MREFGTSIMLKSCNRRVFFFCDVGDRLDESAGLWWVSLGSLVSPLSVDFQLMESFLEKGSRLCDARVVLQEEAMGRDKSS